MNFKDDIHVALPWYIMEKYFSLAYSTGLNLEFGLSSDVLDRLEFKEVERVGELMKNKGLTCTLHAPFLDLSSGALDLKAQIQTGYGCSQHSKAKMHCVSYRIRHTPLWWICRTLGSEVYRDMEIGDGLCGKV